MGYWKNRDADWGLKEKAVLPAVKSAAKSKKQTPAVTGMEPQWLSPTHTHTHTPATQRGFIERNHHLFCSCKKYRTVREEEATKGCLQVVGRAPDGVGAVVASGPLLYGEN